MKRKLNNIMAYANLVPMILAIVIAFCMLFIGAYINGTIHEELEDTMTPATAGTPEDYALSRMNNTSQNFDSALDIVQVVIIITVLAAAIGAIFLFTRFR